MKPSKSWNQPSLMNIEKTEVSDKVKKTTLSPKPRKSVRSQLLELGYKESGMSFRKTFREREIVVTKTKHKHVSDFWLYMVFDISKDGERRSIACEKVTRAQDVETAHIIHGSK